MLHCSFIVLTLTLQCISRSVYAIMELSTLNSGYSDVPHEDFVGSRTHRVGSNDDDAVSNKAQEHATAAVTPNQVSSKLHYSDAGPHREMAVDCPASFIGVKKEPPRLPRPLSTVIHSGSPSSVLKGSQASLSSPGKSYAALGSSTSVHSQQAIALEPEDPAGTASKFPFNRDERDRSERLRRYQEELVKRREMEDRINQEQEQLHASLRGSKKMQDLEEKRTKTHAPEVHDGFDNPNYCTDDGDDQMVPVHSQSKYLQQNAKDSNIIAHNSKSAVYLYSVCVSFLFHCCNTVG